ncbi:hypothetical protein B0H14DRAFT_2577409 [Mycena olivaceomarginata]|nr:hypothetical protein B0H14DRAFT_2577409 [Mycena olivaceomarginata]
MCCILHARCLWMALGRKMRAYRRVPLVIVIGEITQRGNVGETIQRVGTTPHPPATRNLRIRGSEEGREGIECWTGVVLVSDGSTRHVALVGGEDGGGKRVGSCCSRGDGGVCGAEWYGGIDVHAAWNGTCARSRVAVLQGGVARQSIIQGGGCKELIWDPTREAQGKGCEGKYRQGGIMIERVRTRENRTGSD